AGACSPAGLGPGVKHQEAPERLLVPGDPGAMLVETPSSLRAIEETPGGASLICDRPVEKRRELVAQPAFEGHREPLFGPVEKLWRHVAVGELAQQQLLAPAAQLPLRRHAQRQ